MPSEHLLIVEDEEDILELMRYNLTKASYRVTGVNSAEEALRWLEYERPDMILLDVMLPEMSGLELCRVLRSRPDFKQIPILILTAKGEESDVLAGLESGADDYLTKPFSPKILSARINALLRRQVKAPPATPTSLLKVHNIAIDAGRHQVLVDGKEIVLTLTEFKILLLLAKRPGWVFSRQQIVDGVRGEEYAVTERSVDVQIVGLRKKLGAAGKCVETVRGVGYRFKELG